MTRGAWQRLAWFGRDESGSVLVLYAAGLVAFLGFAAMVFDIGRVQATHGELQAFADSVALAAAAELDGRADAITRATAAAALVADTVRYGADTTLSGAGDYTLTFLDGLPASDTASPASFITTAATDASLVRVVVTPRSFDLPFLAALRSLSNSAATARTATVSAEAIAGMTQEACDITPLMFCTNPGWTAAANIGHMVHLRAGGQGAAWGPGDFGFLDTSTAALGSTCAGETGAKLIACLLGAEDNVTRCFSQRGVTTEPGQKNGLNAAAFNTRFDVFEGVMNSLQSNPAYTVAPNIVSGRQIVTNGNGGGGGGNNCTWQPSATSRALPVDTNMADPPVATGTRFGSGVWDQAGYMTTNHPNDAAAVTALIPAEWAGTRYGVYLAEIAHAASAGYAGGAILEPGVIAETGIAQCSGNVSSDPRRRVLVAAAIDCTANPIAGTTTNVPVQEWVEIFMTRPVGTSSGQFDILVEVVGSAGTDGFGGAGAGGIFRDVVQLYR